MESAGDCENIRMKRLFKRITALVSAAALTLSLAACGGSAVSGPKNTAPTNAKPVSITVWTYYNGDQLETFSKLVDEFNATVGKEQNITVEASSQGSVNDLETNVLAAAEGKVGAAEMPNIFSAYADTCYAVDQMGLVADLSGYLTDEELQRILQKKMPCGRLEQVRDVFIFSCFTGLAYIDVRNLTKENIRTSFDGKLWIMTHRHKTQTSVNVPLLKVPQMLLKKYEGTLPDGRLLPVLSNQKLNSYLKEIADLCGIEKNITFHLARHTFATTMTLAKGVPIETVSKMLGHTNIVTTQIYARITNDKIGRDMQALAGQLGEIEKIALEA